MRLTLELLIDLVVTLYDLMLLLSRFGSRKIVVWIKVVELASNFHLDQVPHIGLVINLFLWHHVIGFGV